MYVLCSFGITDPTLGINKYIKYLHGGKSNISQERKKKGKTEKTEFALFVSCNFVLTLHRNLELWVTVSQFIY